MLYPSTWGICIYFPDETLEVGQIYDIIHENEINYLVEHEGVREWLNKRWFVLDTEPGFQLFAICSPANLILGNER